MGEKSFRIYNFGQLFYFHKVKNTSHKGAKRGGSKKFEKYQGERKLNKELFKEKSTQIEILRLVYAALSSDEITPKILENCKMAMTNLSVIGGG